VAWLGGTIVEREQIYGYWEAMLTASFPDRHVTFRNLGWSGDTVWAESRGMFDPPEQGYARMIELTTSLKPTLIILAYGSNEAFDGETGLDRFLTQYRKLVDDLKPTGARFAVLLPLDMDPAAVPSESVAVEYNRSAELYRTSLRKLARDIEAPVIDLAQPAQEEAEINCRLTADGVQWTACGYWALAHRLRNQVDVARQNVRLPAPTAPYPTVATVPSSDPLESLRSEIVAKNELFFHRWRPANFTYLFGFRKYEQGNNAVEMPQFDPLVEKREAEIDALRAKL
jgi:lysophospholipase L1-like esterase